MTPLEAYRVGFRALALAILALIVAVLSTFSWGPPPWLVCIPTFAAAWSAGKVLFSKDAGGQG